jgi:hypothetical protein
LKWWVQEHRYLSILPCMLTSTNVRDMHEVIWADQCRRRNQHDGIGRRGASGEIVDQDERKSMVLQTNLVPICKAKLIVFVDVACPAPPFPPVHRQRSGRETEGYKYGGGANGVTGLFSTVSCNLSWNHGELL